MQRIGKWIVAEFLRILPGLIFFFLAFNLINYTEALMFRRDQVKTFSFPTILIAAGVVAKILLIIDHLPVISMFRKKPLIYDIVWKTFLYSTVALLIRYLTLLFPFIGIEKRSVDFDRFHAAIDWTRFWAIQIWYVILFFAFTLAREVTRAIGREKLQKLLFGRQLGK
jgi:hypothetical protein